jgi:hypothetical protein
MAEGIASRYQRLFEVRILHHYWVDDGATLFDKIVDPNKQNGRLLEYDVRALLDVVPTATTAHMLSRYRCLFKKSALGFSVAASGDAVIPASTILEFIVSTISPSFFDYTALTLRPQKIYELFSPTDGVSYRYKENVPVLSNLSGATRGTAGPNLALFLSREVPGGNANDGVESLVLSGTALMQLTSDNPGAATQQLAAQLSDFPVFVHQDDAPAILPPAGVVGAPARGVELSSDVTNDVFALITLTAVRGDNAAFSFVDGTGAPKPEPPVYQVRFKNRSTIWTYLDKKTGAVNSGSPNPLPLTYFGNAGTKQKPSRGHVKAEMSGAKITGLISEIYV